MSAIATFQVVPAASLNALQAAASSAKLFAALQEVQITAIDFDYSGWILSTLLPVLETEYGIDLVSGNAEIARFLTEPANFAPFVFTPDQQNLIDKLDPSLFDAAKLQADFEAFNQTEAEGVGDAMLAGLQFLRSGLEAMQPDTVGLLSMG